MIWLILLFIAGVVLFFAAQSAECKSGNHHFGDFQQDFYDWEITGDTYGHQKCVFCGEKRTGRLSRRGR